MTAKLWRVLLIGGIVLAGSTYGLWWAMGSSKKVAEGANPPGILDLDGIRDQGEEVGYRRGALELDVRSKYSRIKITRYKNERTMWFVRDNGEEVIESMLNLDRPHDLLIHYTQCMFMSYAFRPKQEKVLIVGLGGGSMVHFLNAYDPKLKVEVVEIDPEIVRIADKYFGVKNGENVKIITQDAFELLKSTEAKYDVIYMDAFLKPSNATDETGAPLRLKTIKFYKEVQKKLAPDGLVVFNINGHDKVEDDLKNIRDAFPQSYAFALPNQSGYVVVGSMAEKRKTLETIVSEGADLDRRFRELLLPEMGTHLETVRPSLTPLEITLGLLIAGVLIALAVYFGWRQCLTWRAVRADAKLPADQRRFLLKQFQRRLFGSFLLLLLAGLMIGALCLDFDPLKTSAEDIPQVEREAAKRTVRLLGAYIIAMLMVVLVMLVLASIDFWATARFSFRQQKQLIQEHHEKLVADLWELEQRISEPEA